MKNYKSKIKFENDALCVKVEHPHAWTREDEESSLRYFQWRFSKMAGRPVSKDEIKIVPPETSCVGP